jgi:hypothetical protein
VLGWELLRWTPEGIDLVWFKGGSQALSGAIIQKTAWIIFWQRIMAIHPDLGEEGDHASRDFTNLRPGFFEMPSSKNISATY